MGMKEKMRVVAVALLVVLVAVAVFAVYAGFGWEVRCDVCGGKTETWVMPPVVMQDIAQKNSSGRIELFPFIARRPSLKRVCPDCWPDVADDVFKGGD